VLFCFCFFVLSIRLVQNVIFFTFFFAVIDVSSLIVLDFSLVVVFSLNMGLFPYHKGALVKVLPQYW